MSPRCFARETRAGVAVVFALTLVPIVAASGAALDYSRAINARRELQARLDTAVLAGAGKELSARVSSAEKIFDAFASSVPGTSRSFSVDGNLLKGTASASVHTALLDIVGIDTVPVAVKATAQGVAAEAAACILVKGTNASDALKANSTIKITAPNCEIHVQDGTYMDNAGNVQPKRLCTKRYGGNNAKPANLESNCTAVSDPFVNKLPAVTLPTNNCSTRNGGNYDGKNNDLKLAGGNYCGFNFNGTHNSVTFQGPANVKNVVFGGITTLNLTPGLYENVTFNSGVTTINLAAGLYIWKSNTNLDSAKLVGTGVTIYYPDSSSNLRSNSGGSYNIKAPTTGTYSGILIYEKSGLASSSFTMDGSSPANFEGLVYLPSRTITFNAGSKITAGKFTLVVNRLALNGGLEWTISPSTKTIPVASGGAAASTSVRLVQ